MDIVITAVTRLVVSDDLDEAVEAPGGHSVSSNS